MPPTVHSEITEEEATEEADPMTEATATTEEGEDPCSGAPGATAAKKKKKKKVRSLSSAFARAAAFGASHIARNS